MSHPERDCALKSAGNDDAPQPPDEMDDPEKVAAFMQAMGMFAAKQKLQLENHQKVVEENQLASRHLAEVSQIKRWLEQHARPRPAAAAAASTLAAAGLSGPPQ